MKVHQSSQGCELIIEDVKKLERMGFKITKRVKKMFLEQKPKP